MKKSLIISLAVLLPYSLGFGATLNSIDKDQVKQVLVNKTFSSGGSARLPGQTIGVIFTGSMDDHGVIRAKFSQPTSQGPQSDRGIYSIKDDGQLCITWQHWRGGKEFCNYVYDAANAYMLVDLDNQFHIVFLKTDIHPSI
jgi:hypothetical protein